jgi:hypothetical protein
MSLVIVSNGCLGLWSASDACLWTQVISVARRPEALHRSAALVGVLHNGVLAEFGSPSELSARRGLYSSLLQSGSDMGGVAEPEVSSLSKASASNASVGAVAQSASKRRISQLMDSFDQHLDRCSPQQGPALEALRGLVAEMRATTL